MKKSWNKVSASTSMCIRILHQKFGNRICELQKQYPNIPQRTISYHAKLPMNAAEHKDQRKNNPGRPPKLSERDARKITFCINRLRRNGDPNFSLSRLRKECGLQLNCSLSTFHRAVRKLKYRYMNSRHKGMLTRKDMKLKGR